MKINEGSGNESVTFVICDLGLLTELKMENKLGETNEWGQRWIYGK